MARTLERRLEGLVGKFAGRVFSGRVHPSEIVTRLAREADLARFDHTTGPATANTYRLLLNPASVTGDPSEMEKALNEEIEGYAAFEGLRLAGPVQVELATSPDVPPGRLECRVAVVPGAPAPWAVLISGEEEHRIGHNRASIGRGEDADIRVTHDDVSRSHAIIWRKGGRFFVRDLESVNGTTLDGRRVGPEPAVFEDGAIIGVALHRYRFVIL